MRMMCNKKWIVENIQSTIKKLKIVCYQKVENHSQKSSSEMVTSFLQMKWLWQNRAQIGFGKDAVKEHLNKFVTPKSKVLCLFGGGSIDKNGARSDVNDALSKLKCEVRWEGGIPPNPEYDRLVEIVSVVKEFKPDVLLAVGGGSVIDGTKFIAVAATYEGENIDYWDEIIIKKSFQGTPLYFGAVLTIPATGTEWNHFFSVSRRSINWKAAATGYVNCYPQFSLIDPKYTMTLPVKQIRNGVFDAFTHCADFVLAPIDENKLFDNFMFSVMKELVEIGPEVVKPNSSLELHERLIVCASFALNTLFNLGRFGCFSIHHIADRLTAKYGIDHGATLSMVMPVFYEHTFEARKERFAAAAEFIFDVHEGTVEDKARLFLENVNKFIDSIGIAKKVSDWEGVTINENDVDEVTNMVMEQTNKGQPFGCGNCGTPELVRSVLKKVIV
ncbi:alcohol dehydrogenase, iron-containing family protein [Tritrichomonas foetus]|uniref:Alcohol dehydrogenase, iron-containing family protein n=1 Tax=Tritrichomonas foetus TaxID=1144522 RepID=A0A1J4JC49_9EUKA|nr:alcohol dehydrogenase, iron-containing family protein [Tritrichomonas foetus]|eukprot:OHS95227.1 alcohol dehydrogenase, iron-containing family protein [Tritrichomonas foetus]